MHDKARTPNGRGPSATHHNQQLTHHRAPHSRTTYVVRRTRAPQLTNSNYLTCATNRSIHNTTTDNNTRLVGTPSAHTVDSAHTVNITQNTTHTSAHIAPNNTMPLALSNWCVSQLRRLIPHANELLTTRMRYRIENS